MTAEIYEKVKNMKTLALIVPCFNEADVLGMFYEETTKVIDSLRDRYSTELVFVDDGSRDDTLRIIKELAARNSAVKFISFSRNFGKEAAMLAGMEYAVRADFIGILDADLQHSPGLIPEMLHFVDDEGYDVAAANREDREGEGKLKSFLSESFYKVINKVSETKITESAQDFRIMRKDVVKAIISLPENIRFSKELLEELDMSEKRVIGVSTEFHLPRIMILAERYGLTLDACAAPSPSVFNYYINMMREYLSYIKMSLFDKAVFSNGTV